MGDTLTKAEVSQLTKVGYVDPVFFCRTFLRHWFSNEMPWFHRGALAILLRRADFLPKYGELDKIIKNFVYKADPTDPESKDVPIFARNGETITMTLGKYTLLKWPRGFSKTTLINAIVIFVICYIARKFIVYLSQSSTHSCDQLGNIKRELEQNERLRAVFGDLVPNRQDSAKWTSNQIQPVNGVVAVALGRGGQVRGSLIGGHRPDLIIVDDVEDEESVRTPEQREKTHKWFYESVVPALAKINAEDASIVVAGTLLHHEALLQVIERDPVWTTLVFSAVDKGGEPLWADMMTLEELDVKKHSFQLAGNLAGFYREYHNQTRHFKESKFRQDMFRYPGPYHEGFTFVGKALAMDPAISKKPGACYCAYAVVGMTDKGLIVLLDTYAEIGMPVRAQVDKYFELFKIWRPTKCGIEAIAYQRALIHLTQEEMFRFGCYFEVIPITHGAVAQHERIEAVLQPRYAAGYVIHMRRFPMYESCLLDWPRGKSDVVDAAAMAITLLDPYAGAAAGDASALTRDEYPPLEKVVGGEWRTAP